MTLLLTFHELSLFINHTIIIYITYIYYSVMRQCINDPNKSYTRNEKSPKGLGWCAYSEKVGTKMIGRDGKVYVIKKTKNHRKIWSLSEFYKNYKKSENKLIALLKKVL
jgi:hypothetical protein